ncbi:hypothetical protein [Nocardia sp. NPDC050710]|uniref:hypothetical protein n=1 Tax=Nocardia sp. NPDC050710 TaxID=3157220 RepID=UPI0033E1B421
MASRSVPQPPFSAELLADLHADNVAPELSAQLWPVVRNDSDALSYLCALDDVSAHIHALGREERIIHAMPADVAARLDRFVDELDLSEDPTDRVATVHRLPSAVSSPGISSAPADSEDRTERIAAPIDLNERRGNRLRWLAAAAAAIAVIAGVGAGALLLRGNEATPTAQPTPSNPIDDELSATVALAALGRNNVTGPLGSQAALTRCVRAAGLERVILGSTDMTYQGKNAVLILLAGPNPPKITALVVGPGCSTGDPQVRNITDIG